MICGSNQLKWATKSVIPVKIDVVAYAKWDCFEKIIPDSVIAHAI